MDGSLPRAPFPAPPPFYKAFTTANLARLADLEPSSSSDPSPSNTQQTTTQPLPLPLTYFQPPPPPPPTAETYPTFSLPNALTITPVLPPSDILLYNPNPTPPSNPAALLLRLTKSLLLNFLELITLLSEAPESSSAKIEEIRRIVVNVHAVLNGYRPHQGREGVRAMLEGMLEEGEREVEGVERVKGMLEGFRGEVKAWKDGNRGDAGLGGVGGEEKTETEGDGVLNGISGVKKQGEEAGMSEERIREVRRLWRIIGEIGEE